MKEVIVRSISGVVFVAVILASLLLSPFTYLAVFAVVVSFVMSEYLRLTIGEGKFLLKVASIAAGVLLFILSFFYSWLWMESRMSACRPGNCGFAPDNKFIFKEL